MSKDALMLALEALKQSKPQLYGLSAQIAHEEAITAIKAVLKANDEPVVWNEGVPAMLPKQKEGETFIVSYEPKLEAKDEPDQYAMDIECTKCGAKQSGVLTVHTTSPKQEVKDEPVGEVSDHDWSTGLLYRDLEPGTPLYTTPPQRTWVGLTDEEISELIRATHNTGSFVRAIEAKLKEKNT